MNTNDDWKDNLLVSPKLDQWEQWYPLVNDPGLHVAGVEIGARVTPQPDKPSQLRIVFRAGKAEASVECVHVAVYAGPLESLPPDAELARSSEQHPVTLAPEEHFFALNSYVAGIAEVGLGVMFAMAREAGNLPVGFNALMQQQVLKALARVAPAASLDLCLWIIDDATLSGRDSAREFLAPMRGALTDLLKGDINLPPEVLARLAGDDDVDVRRAVAEHKNTPPEVRAYLAEIASREAMARNEHTQPDALTRLAGDADAGVRERVAGNPNLIMCSQEIFKRLVTDEVAAVRQAVARNHNAPPEVLARLSGDEDPRVRWGVAVNAHAPPGVLARLAGDPDKDVRRIVAGNARTPREVLARLASDTDWYVREKLLRKRRSLRPTRDNF